MSVKMINVWQIIFFFNNITFRSKLEKNIIDLPYVPSVTLSVHDQAENLSYIIDLIYHFSLDSLTNVIV